MTIKLKLITILEAKDWKKVNSRSTKYVVLKHPDNLETKMFIGKRGSLRIGKTVKDSRSLTGTQVYKKLLSDFENLTS